MKKKYVTVEMAFSWTFDERDWSEQKEHIQKMKDEPRIIFGHDMINSFYCLNDIVPPDLTHIKVTNVDE